MNKTPKISTIAAANALLTVLYIILIATFFSYGHVLLGNKPDNLLMPVAMLSLFVFSAALTGSLMLGRPILWYMEGRKAEALRLFAYTMGIFLLTTLAIFVFLIVL